MIAPIFQPETTPENRAARARLENAFASLIQNSDEGSFTLIFDAISEMRRTESVLWRSMRGNHLIKAIFDLVDAEDKYRCARPIDERKG